MKNLLFFEITSKVLRIQTENIDSISSLESGLSFDSICSVGILDSFKVIVKTSFLKIETLNPILGDEDIEDDEMRAYLEKKKKKSKKKKIKKEKKDPKYDEFDPSQFADAGGDFGWAKKDANQKQFKPGKLRAQVVFLGYFLN